MRERYPATRITKIKSDLTEVSIENRQDVVQRSHRLELKFLEEEDDGGLSNPCALISVKAPDFLRGNFAFVYIKKYHFFCCCC